MAFFNIQGTHCTGKTGKMAKTNSLSGKTQGILKFCQNTGKTGNLVCSSWKFPDSKGTRYFNTCCKNFHFSFKLDKSAKSNLCTWVCNIHKSHKLLAQGKFVVRQGNHKENMGNLKMQFERVP